MINLGDKNWGVKDSGLLAYKQVGSKYFNKDFDFTRASNGTYVDKNGVLQTAELYNLLDYSNDFSRWNVQNVTGGQIGYDGTNNAWIEEGPSRLQRNISLSSGVYTGSIYVKADFSNYVLFYIVGTTPARVVFELIGDGSIVYNQSVASSIEKVSSNGWYRLSITLNSDISTFRIYPLDDASETQTTNSSIYVQDAQLVEGTEPLDYQYTNGRVGIPRIDFSDGVGALLLEPQRTNLVLYSEQFDNAAWVKLIGGTGINPIITPNAVISPDGTQNAETVVFNRGVGNTISDQSSLDQSITIPTTNTYIFTVYAKATTAADVGKQIFLRVGSAGALTPITLTANWLRYSTLETSVSSGSNLVQIGNRGAITSNNTVSVDLWGAQLEVGSYSTSYIKTEGSAVTRTADVANNCGSEQDFNSEEGVLYAEIAALANDLTNRTIALSDGTTSNTVRIQYLTVSNAIWATVTNIGAGGNQAILQYTSSDITINSKVALKYKANDFSLWVNGIEVATDTSGVTFSANTLNTLQFDRGNGNENFYGKVRSVKYFPEALGDTKLMTLTGGDGSLQGLFNTFQARVLADGGYIESQDCIINEIKELL